MNKKTTLSLVVLFFFITMMHGADSDKTALEQQQEQKVIRLVKQQEKHEKVVMGMQKLAAAGYSGASLVTILPNSKEIANEVGRLRLNLGITVEQLWTGQYPEATSSGQQADIVKLQRLMQLPCMQLIIAASKIDQLIPEKARPFMQDPDKARRQDLLMKSQAIRELRRSGKKQ